MLSDIISLRLFFCFKMHLSDLAIYKASFTLILKQQILLYIYLIKDLIFKKYFYQKHHSGMTARQIFTECGIDPDVLGASRIDGFCYTLNKQAKRDFGFADNRSQNYRQVSKDGEPTVEARIKQLEHELAYTRQEVEFLKKLQMADMEARRQWESRHQPT